VPSIYVVPAGHTGPINDIIPIMNGPSSITSVASIERSTLALTARASYRPSTEDRTEVDPGSDSLFISDVGMIAAENLNASMIDPVFLSAAGTVGNVPPRLVEMGKKFRSSKRGIGRVRTVGALPTLSPGPLRQAQ